MMLTNAILQTSERSECRRSSSPARANLWAALVVPRAGRLVRAPEADCIPAATRAIT
jgi:hypothetical protein